MDSRKITASSGLSVTRINSAPVWSCPHCLNSDTPLTFTDGDTLQVGFKEPEDYSLWAGYMKGACDHCGESVYFLEIARVSEIPDGYHFANDNCFSSEEDTIYRVNGKGHEWTIFHHAGVSDVFFTPRNPESKQESFVSKARMDWLDVHTIGPDAFKDCPPFFERAYALFNQLRHDILTVELPAGE